MTSKIIIEVNFASDDVCVWSILDFFSFLCASARTWFTLPLSKSRYIFWMAEDLFQILSYIVDVLKRMFIIIFGFIFGAY